MQIAIAALLLALLLDAIVLVLVRFSTAYYRITRNKYGDLF